MPCETDLGQRAGHGEDLRSGSEVESFDSAYGWVYGQEREEVKMTVRS